MITLDQYTNHVESQLQTHTTELTTKLSEIIQKQYHADVSLLQFELFDYDAGSYGLMMYCLDAFLDEVFPEDANVDGFSESVHVFEDLQTIDFDVFNQEEFDTFIDTHDEQLDKINTRIFAKWFDTCWTSAGGYQIQLDVRFCAYDHFDIYDLKNRVWIEELVCD
ncbi:MAG: hypothetical protein ACRC5C_00095 [Bacilli bacterium]